MASLIIAYLLWSFGGVLGLHHLYLGRPFHAFVWYSTLGGVFGLGWMRELWRLPDYVRSSNSEKDYQTYKLSLIGLHPRPSCGLPRFVGMFVMGYVASAVLCGVLPQQNKDESMTFLYQMSYICLTILGSSLGVYAVANIGELQCSWKYPVCGSLISFLWLLGDRNNFATAALLSTLVTWWFGLCWKPVAPLNKNRVSKTGGFLLAAMVWSSVFCYGVYFNTSVIVNGEKVPMKEFLGNVFASPAWYRIKDSFYRLFTDVMEEGWDYAYEDASDLFDFSGETKALKLLGLPGTASPEEITKTCRKMSAQSHPDRAKTEEDKAKAQSRFIEIQNACSTLARFRSKRRTSHYSGGGGED